MVLILWSNYSDFLLVQKLGNCQYGKLSSIIIIWNNTSFNSYGFTHGLSHFYIFCLEMIAIHSSYLLSACCMLGFVLLSIVVTLPMPVLSKALFLWQQTINWKYSFKYMITYEIHSCPAMKIQGSNISSFSDFFHTLLLLRGESWDLEIFGESWWNLVFKMCTEYNALDEPDK